MGCSKQNLVNHIVFAALELKDYSSAVTISYQTSFQDLEKLLGSSSSTGLSTSSVWWFRRRRKVYTCDWQFFSEEVGSQSVPCLLDEGILAFARGSFKKRTTSFLTLPSSTLLTKWLETTARSAFCFCTCAVRRTPFVFWQMLWMKRQWQTCKRISDSTWAHWKSWKVLGKQLTPLLRQLNRLGNVQVFVLVWNKVELL